MSLLAVAALALVFGGVTAWLVRLGAADQRELRAELARDREAFYAHMEREAEANRAERAALADRIQNPLGPAASMWPVAEAQRETLEDVDREWLESEDSQTEWAEDLILADAEVEG